MRESQRKNLTSPANSPKVRSSRPSRWPHLPQYSPVSVALQFRHGGSGHAGVNVQGPPLR